MKTITTRQGEMWDEISYRVYGDEHHVHRLVHANWTQRHVRFFSAGTVLNVPTLPDSVLVSTNLPAWRRTE